MSAGIGEDYLDNNVMEFVNTEIVVFTSFILEMSLWADDARETTRVHACTDLKDDG
jgi:hypothetical protein